MRQMISGLVAAIAVVTVSAAPAMACYTGCAAPQVFVSPAPVYSGCNTGCGGWAHERLPDPVHQYYYVNQGPTYTGPGNWAPQPTYQESAVYTYRHRPWRTSASYYHVPRAYHHNGRYGAPRYHYGYRHEPVLRRYY
jgi:hypothetical protein